MIPNDISSGKSPACGSLSIYQRAVVDDAATGEGHTVVRARAGSGKTTTLLQAMGAAPRRASILMAAFNREIADELGRRAPRGVETKTLHALGFAAVRRAFGNVPIDRRKVDAILRKHVLRADERGEIARAVSLAKGSLAQTDDEIAALALEFNLGTRTQTPAEIGEVAAWALEQSNLDTSCADFDDMIALPLAHQLAIPAFDRVFVDETQDLNAAQIQLALLACRKGGRVCAVGDDRQAIYRFRGADEHAVGRVTEALRAKVLPLSVTYRCAESIVKVAREVVPDLEPRPGADEGLVESVGIDRVREDAEPGDFVISRKNAPLLGLCLGFLIAGIPARVAGRDIGAGLVSIIRRIGATSVDGLLDGMKEWARGEMDRLLAIRADADTSTVSDTFACVRVLARGATSVEGVIATIDSLFSDDLGASDVVTCGTTHKLKGLEAERAWVLRDTYRRRPSVEEENLWYVAVTRAKHELYLVAGGDAQ